MTNQIIVDNEKITAIANAIRSKNGSQSLLNLDEMATEISNLPGEIVPVFKVPNHMKFAYSSAFPEDLDFGDVTDMDMMFYQCTTVKSVPDLSTCKNIYDATFMFAGCESLLEIPSFNATNVSNIKGMFACCYKVPEINVETFLLNNMERAFAECENLRKVSVKSTSIESSVDATSAFYKCHSLTDVSINVYSFKNMNSMFYECSNLAEIPVMNTSQITSAGMFNAFQYCPSLSENSLNNIMEMCAKSKVSSTYKKLKSVGLTSEQANVCKGLSNWEMFTAAGWTTGY